MIIRIVKLSFHTEHIETFKSLFENSKSKIKAFDGCEHLTLLQDVKQPNVFFTYSHWQSESDLNKYRHSDTFKSIWQKTKPLFNDKPQAWSTSKISEG